jgi:hypothetical protein
MISHSGLLEQLANMRNDEIKAYLNQEDSPARFVLAYHFFLARDAYHCMFTNFRRVVSKPQFFLPALLDCLEIDFNTRLFLTTRALGDCKGLIFELDGGVSPADRMGILLTPLALTSPATFFGTLFHELSHRLHFAREGKHPDRISSELYAYLHDKFLLRSFLAEIDLSWFSPSFEFDLFDLAQKLREQAPTFLKDTADRFASDVDRIEGQLLARGGAVPSLNRPRVERICRHARMAGRVPRVYESFTDFLWLYATRLYSVYRIGSQEDLPKIHTTCLLLLILFSQEYEQKFHPHEHNWTYGHVTIIHTDGTLTEEDRAQALRYCSFQKFTLQEEFYND